jgi:hypothetical protein
VHAQHPQVTELLRQLSREVPGLEPPRDAGAQPLPGEVRHGLLELPIFRADPGGDVE